jgi:hypothetical protein
MKSKESLSEIVNKLDRLGVQFTFLPLSERWSVVRSQIEAIYCHYELAMNIVVALV